MLHIIYIIYYMYIYMAFLALCPLGTVNVNVRTTECWNQQALGKERKYIN